MIHALNIIKTVNKMIVDNISKTTIACNTHLVISPFYLNETLVPVKIFLKSSDITDSEFQKDCHKNYFRRSPEIKIQKSILIKNIQLVSKFELKMINLSWSPHKVLAARLQQKSLDNVDIPLEVLHQFNKIYSHYQDGLITNSEMFNQKYDILNSHYTSW